MLCIALYYVWLVCETFIRSDEMEIIMADLDRANEVNITLFVCLIYSEQQQMMFKMLMSLLKLLYVRKFTGECCYSWCW